MFGGFTQGGFSVFGQALESLGNMVAPIPDEEKIGEGEGEGRSQSHEDDGDGEDHDDDGNNFDNVIQQFIQQKRDEQLVREKSEKRLLHKPVNISTADITSPQVPTALSTTEGNKVDKEAEKMFNFPESPGSLVTVTLDDEESKNGSDSKYLPQVDEHSILPNNPILYDELSSINDNRRYSTSSLSTIDMDSPHQSSDIEEYTYPIDQQDNTDYANIQSQISHQMLTTFSNTELEKKVQLKYRETLENNYQELETRFLELQQDNHRLKQQLQSFDGTNNTVLGETTDNNVEYEKIIRQLNADLTVKDEKIQSLSNQLAKFQRLEQQNQELLSENNVLSLNNQDIHTKLQEKSQQCQQITSQYHNLQHELETIKHQLSIEKQLTIESEHLQQQQLETIQNLKQEKDSLQRQLQDSSTQHQRLLEEKEKQLRQQVQLLEKYVEENDSVHEKYEHLIENLRIENQELHTTIKSSEEKLQLLEEKNYRDIQTQYADLSQRHQSMLSHTSTTTINSNEVNSPVKEETNGHERIIETSTTGTSPIPFQSPPSSQQQPYHHPQHEMILKLTTNYIDSMIRNIQEFCQTHEIMNPLPETVELSQSSSNNNNTAIGEISLQYVFHSLQLFEQMIEQTSHSFQEGNELYLICLQILQKLLMQFFPEINSKIQELFPVEEKKTSTGDDSIDLPDHTIMNLPKIMMKVCQFMDAQFRSYQERERTNQEIHRQEVKIWQEKEKELNQSIQELRQLSQQLQARDSQISQELHQKTNLLHRLEQEKKEIEQQLQQRLSQDQQSKQQFQKLTMESHEKLNQLSKLEEEKNTFISQSQEYKAKLIKAENENKQLLTVINQLRNARKDKTSEHEQLSQELITLRQQYQVLQQEYQELKQKYQQSQQVSQQYQLLQNDYQKTVVELQHLQQEITTYESTTQHYSTQLLQKEQQLYEKQRLLDNYHYEEKLLTKSVEQLTLENTNLKTIIEGYQQQSTMEINLWKQKYQEVVQQLQTLQQSQELQWQQEKQRIEQEFQQEKQQLLNQIEEKNLQVKQLRYDHQREKQSLQKNMEKTIQQLQNTTNNVIDKMLIGNLIVSYFQRRRSREVLGLIAKILQFNDEQLVIVGLKVPNINYVQSFFQNFIGINPPPVEETPVEGSSLAELWVDHLIKLAEEPAKPKSSSNPPRSPSMASQSATGHEGGIVNYNTSIMRSSSGDSQK